MGRATPNLQRGLALPLGSGVTRPRLRPAVDVTSWKSNPLLFIEVAMPFVNDLLEHNRERLAQAAQAASPAVRRPSRFLFEPATVMQLLRSRIVGQDAVLTQVEAMLTAVKADIGDPHRPLAVNLFIGPTGVGKTEIVRLLAQAIHDQPDAFCRIDMNTLAQEHYAAALTGAPPGYVGSKEGTTLFDAEAIAGSYGRPGIVLFDELEKASTEVLRSLLNVLDSGRLTLAAGTRSIDFRNSLIFMTSNIGAQDAWAYRERFERGWRRLLRLRPRDEAALLERALHRRFDPEFINRIDRILSFARIDDDQLERLLLIELAKLNQRLARRGLQLQADASLIGYFRASHDPRFGARHLVRQLRRELEPKLATCLLDHPHCTLLRAKAVAGELRVEETYCARTNTDRLRHTLYKPKMLEGDHASWRQIQIHRQAGAQGRAYRAEL
jgi:ATP-dependent Clp protease ATP-binding subunit ClpA